MARPSHTYRCARRDLAKRERHSEPRRTRGNVIDSINNSVRHAYYITRLTVGETMIIFSKFPDRTTRWQ